MGILDRLTRKKGSNQDDADAALFKWGRLVDSDKPAELSLSPKQNVELKPVSQSQDKASENEQRRIDLVKKITAIAKMALKAAGIPIPS